MKTRCRRSCSGCTKPSLPIPIPKPSPEVLFVAPLSVHLWRLVQGLRQVDHPLRKLRLALRNLPHGDRPMVQPARALFAKIGIGQAVCGIAERLFQSNEAVPAFSKDVEQFANVIGFELVGMDQENLLRLVSEKARGKLFC